MSAAPRTAIRSNKVGCSLAASNSAHAPTEKPMASTDPCLAASSRIRSAASRPTASLEVPWPGRSTPITVRPPASSLSTQPPLRHSDSKFDATPLMRSTGRDVLLVMRLSPLTRDADMRLTWLCSARACRLWAVSRSGGRSAGLSDSRRHAIPGPGRPSGTREALHYRMDQDVLCQEYIRLSGPSAVALVRQRLLAN